MLIVVVVIGSASDDSEDESGEDAGDKANLVDNANALLEDVAAKSKQSRSEKKARKAMSKLGLKLVSWLCHFP